MTSEQVKRTKAALLETLELQAKEMAYQEHLRKQDRLAFYSSHIAKLEGMLEEHKILESCRRELSFNFECPSEQILGVYGAQLGLSSRQMFDRITEGL